jgi:hypothetical protein
VVAESLVPEVVAMMADMLVWTVVVLTVAAIALAALVALRPRREVDRRPAAPEVVGGTSLVILDIEPSDPRAPAVRRLVLDAAVRRFRAVPEAAWVEVLSRSGAPLGRIPRHRQDRPGVAVPATLREPRAAPSRRPDPVAHAYDRLVLGGAVSPPEAELPPTERAPLADRFDLPEPVRARLRHRDDPVDLVRAILEGGGIRAEVRDDVLLAGDRAVAVVGASGGGFADPRALNHAYLRLAEATVLEKLVLSLRVLEPVDARRRAALAPDVRYAGPEAVQRMADAVAVGEDPLRFVLATPVTDGEVVGAGG